MIKGKTPEEIRKTFNIKNDLTPSETEEMRKENEWCEETNFSFLNKNCNFLIQFNVKYILVLMFYVLL